MNILVSDSWLRSFLKTKATPQQIKEYLSLCGPSVERINEDSGEPVYEIEITTNRPDSMSVFGVAREASVILPRFGIAAELINDPYKNRTKAAVKPGKKLSITTDPILNPRWTSVIMTNIKVTESPKWLMSWLTQTGIRPINTIVDVTNYLMRAYGQPAHAFDYDRIGKKNGVPTMKLRASRKGEKLTTLDGKTHTLPGDDIVIEDGAGHLIDLCGIMGGANSSIADDTTAIILFLQTYEPTHIRKTSMKLAHRTEAAGLFEKGVDSELVMPALLEGMRLIKEIAGGEVASTIYDLYPHPYKPHTVSVQRNKVDSYIGTQLPDKEIITILSSLGFKPTITKIEIAVKVPSFRRDVEIDVDIIEEIARIYGYHRIVNKLPEGQIPVVIPDPELQWEEEVKLRLRDWGFTELMTYSMITEKQLEVFGSDKTKAYKLANPLSDEWVYMRPQLFPSVLAAVSQNLHLRKDIQVFELSMAYVYRPNELPLEKPTLIVLWSGEKFLKAKGLAESIFNIMRLDFQKAEAEHTPHRHNFYTQKSMTLGSFGSLGELNSNLLHSCGITTAFTRLYMDFGVMTDHATRVKQYSPIPKHPPSVEDLAFVVPAGFTVGPLINALKHADPKVYDVRLLDVHDDTRTLHITYLDPAKTLTSETIATIREKLLVLAKKKFNVSLKTT